MRRAFAALSFALPAGFALFRPLGLDTVQSLLLGILAQVIVAWSADLVRRDIASAYLLLCFLLVGKASAVQVLNFPLSPNFVLIASAFLLSAAMTRSGLADRLAGLAFSRFAGSPRGLLLFSYVAGAALIVLVPQPFPRVIVMASMYSGYLERTTLAGRDKAALLLGIFVASTGTSMLFLSGDLVLNSAALGFAGVSVTHLGWMSLMTVPALAVTAASYAVMVIVFRIGAEPFGFVGTAGSDATSIPGTGTGRGADAGAGRGGGAPLTPGQARVAVLAAVLVALWLTEPIHRIPAAWSAAAVVVALFAVRALGPADLKEVNLSLVLFITAAFSIGRVLDANGIAGRLNAVVLGILPAPDSALFYPALAGLVMVLHTALGSAVTTLSVAVPPLVDATAGAVPPALVALLACSVVNMQYFLPIHHVTIMIGAGKGYYSQRETIRIGAVMAAVVMAWVSLVLVPWWMLVGAL